MPPPLHKLINITLQACGMCIISNLIAQSITAYKSNTPFTINWLTIYQFLLWTLISTPPNYLLQSYIESLLPSHRRIPPLASQKPTSTTSHPQNPSTTPSKLNIKNTLIKFAIDQTLMATLNTLGFSAGMARIRGASTQTAWEKAKREYWPVMRAGWKLWPWVSLANFSLVGTVEGRQFVGGVAGLVWGVYLSLFYAK